MMKQLPKYTLGVGDRFAMQARAQLEACRRAGAEGVGVVPVWNKSHREHTTIGSAPDSQRAAADSAVRELDWKDGYFVDADHIHLGNVETFLTYCDFFTIDVASYIGQEAPLQEIEAFARRHPELGLAEETIRVAGQYLAATKEAGKIYRHIESAKGAEPFAVEVSMDETDQPQTPPELLLILAALADEGVPAQTIAPKFTGRFNKGVDYVGDVAVFAREFEEDVKVLAQAVERYGLPGNLKLSVHSGSDKFSLYPEIRRIIGQHDAGVHLKTAGTTWLEELIGLAEAGDEGLALAKEVYAEAYGKREELCAPYAEVIDIDPAKLPAPSETENWSAVQFADALRHDQSNPAFNAHFRQLLHVGYKVAAKMGARYTDMVKQSEESVARNVTENLLERHIRPLLIG